MALEKNPAGITTVTSLGTAPAKERFSLAFASLIGQESAKNTLLSYSLSNKTPHALLFTGPQSTGKYRAARCFAAFFADSLKSPFKANPDIHIVHKEDKKDIPVQKIRELCSKLQLKPFSAPQVVAVIKDAERMSLAAANSLLKTLEEPNSNIKIILTSSSPNRLPETIVSRVQEVPFTGLSKEEIKKILSSMLQESESHKLIKDLSEISANSLELLGLENLISEETLEPSDQGELREHLNTLEEKLRALQKKISRLEKLPSKDALILADELAREKDQLPVWQLLIQKSRSDLREGDNNLQRKAAKLLENTLRAKFWTEERNANASMQLSEVLLRYSL